MAAVSARICSAGSTTSSLAAAGGSSKATISRATVTT
jgi:hypothetical protein